MNIDKQISNVQPIKLNPVKYVDSEKWEKYWIFGCIFDCVVPLVNFLPKIPLFPLSFELMADSFELLTNILPPLPM